MKIIKNEKIITQEEFITGIKKLYERGVVTENKSATLLINLIIKLVDKIDVCTSTCFENLEKKKSVSCACNGDEITILVNHRVPKGIKELF